LRSRGAVPPRFGAGTSGTGASGAAACGLPTSGSGAMIGLAGFGFLLAMVFGGYMAAGGNLEIILRAVPFELMIIAGAATGAFLMANPPAEMRRTLSGLRKIVQGGRYTKADYVELLSLLYWLMRQAQAKGALGLEPHIENPRESPIFAR